jgi:WD repeat-containing protein 68
MNRVPVGSGALNAPGTAPPNPSFPAQYQTPRRAAISGRQPDELHIPSVSAGMGDYNRYQAPPAYGAGDSLSINVQPSTPQHLGGPAGNTLPGALQPGPMVRPGPLSSNTAPGSIPTLPHISTQMQQPPASARPANPNHSHSYSRSSPTSLEQVKYKAFTNTPEAAKYGSSNTMSIPQTPQTASYSPLGLADIRPRTDAGFSDDPTSPGFYHGGADPQYPTNSNYLAPWPIYATDWCKWPPRPHSSHAGKVAIGSYLEDNHNYVRFVPLGFVE